MRGGALILLPLTVLSGLTVICGCSLSSQARLEASLRHNENKIRGLQQQLTSAKQQLRDQENELLALKQSPGGNRVHTASSSRAVETIVAWGVVTSLEIHSLTSGILGTPDGGRIVNLVLQPVDGNGEVVKVAGELEIRVQLPGKNHNAGSDWHHIAGKP